MRIIRIMLGAAFILLVLSAPALCQMNNGTLTGVVKDPSGAIIPGVLVAIVQTDTNFTTNTTTAEDGRYRVPSLLPGPYRITFEASGFKRLVRDGVTLRVGDVLPIDAMLEIGGTNEQIEVSAAGTLLQTETTSSGTITAGEILYTMPLFQHSVIQTMAIMPAVAQTTNGPTHRIGSYTLAGQRTSGTAVFEDGVFAVDPTASSAAIYSIESAVDEVKVLTSTLSAEFGHTAGGVMTVTKKSGTNGFHGQAGALGYSRLMQHRQYFQVTRPTDPQPGAPDGTPVMFLLPDVGVGGPVYIPHLYDGRNKTFFYFGYQRLLEKYANAYVSFTPTLEQLAGDFTFGGKGNVLYDPATTRKLADGTWTRDPFPTKVLPSNRIDPVAKKILSYQPWNPPNTTGSLTSTGPVSNYTFASRRNNFYDDYSLRLDHQFTTNVKLFGSWTRNATDGILPATSLRVPDFDGEQGYRGPTWNQNYAVGLSWMLNATTLNEVRVGYFRAHTERRVASYNESWGSLLGIPNIDPMLMPGFSPASARTGLAVSQTSPPLSSMYGLITNSPTSQIREAVSFRDDFSKMIGAHSFKVGYEVLNFRGNYWQTGQPSGTFDFTNMTAGLQPNGQPIPNTGNDFAALQLGYVGAGTFSTYTTTWLPRDRIHSLYFQDDWKVTSNLTLNLGLRWSTESPYHTAHGKQSNFDPNATDPLTGKKGAIVHPTDSLSDRVLTNFQPRFGVAWHPLDKWVFRGGFGLNTIDMRWPNALQQFDEYQAISNQQQISGDPRPIFKLSDGPAPVKYDIREDGSAVYVGKNLGARNVSWIVPNLHPAYALNWNLTAEFEMSENDMLRLTYQGSAGVGLLESWNVNVFPTSLGANDPALRAAAFAAEQNYLPYPQFGRISQLSNSGHSTYHGGTIQYERRRSHGLVVGAFFTYSKVLDQCDSDSGVCAGRMPIENRRLEKGPAGFDMNRRFVVNANYQLPFGSGKRYLNRGGVWNYIFGGYELSWVQTFASGNPLAFSFTNSPSNYYSTNISARYPNFVGDRPQQRPGWRDVGPDRFNQANSNAVFPISGFAYPAAFTVGNAGRNVVLGPGRYYSHMKAKKIIKIKEQASFEVHLDMQNVFHNYAFKAPTTSVDFRNPQLFGKLTTDGGSMDAGGQPVLQLTLMFKW